MLVDSFVRLYILTIANLTCGGRFTAGCVMNRKSSN